MIVRTMARGLALSTIALPGAAWCLGLGDITVDTALNQPLRAEIKLLSVSPGELDDMRVTLASKETFDRIGIQRPFVLSQLEFKSAWTPDGHAILEVTSKQPLREPFLNFLVEVEWPNGRLLREYTVLLDPPVFMEQRQAARVQVPEVAPQAGVTAPPARVSSAVPQEFARPDVNAPAVAGELNQSSEVSTAGESVEYTVANGDTLYAIAERFRPNAGVSASQVMLGILHANPQAFADGNINNLKAGAVLRIPADDALAMPDAREAFAEVARQNEQWQDDQTRPDILYDPAAAPAKLERAREQARGEDAVATKGQPQAEDATGSATIPQDESRLRIMASEKRGAETRSTGANESALAQELAESRRVEIEALSAKLAELELIVTKQERIIQLQADALTELQQRVGGVDAVEEPAAPEALAGSSAAASGAVTKQATPPGSMRDSERAGASDPGAQPTPTEPTGLIEAMFANPAMLVGLGAGAILIFALIWLSIRRAASNRAETVDLATYAGENLDGADAKQGAAVGHGQEEVAVSGAAAKPIDQVESMHDNEASTTSADPADKTPEQGTESVNDDTLAEADVYIAYGLQQQAEDLLKEAVKSNPTNIDYRLKLLEVHYATKNVAGFETEAHALHQTLAGNPSGVWERVAAMGTQLNARNPLFVGLAAGTVGEQAASAGISVPDRDASQTARSEHSREGDVKGGHLARETASDHARDDHIVEFEATDLEATAIADFSAQASKHTLDVNEAALDIDLSDLDVQTGTDAEPSLPMMEMPPADPELALGWEQQSDFNAGAVSDDGDLLITELEMSDESMDEPPDALMTETLLENDDALNADEFSSLSDDNEAGTKLDLARAYLDMGDADGAMSTLAEVIEEGDDEQRKEAEVLMRRIA